MLNLIRRHKSNKQAKEIQKITNVMVGFNDYIIGLNIRYQTFKEIYLNDNNDVMTEEEVIKNYLKDYFHNQKTKKELTKLKGRKN